MAGPGHTLRAWRTWRTWRGRRSTRRRIAAVLAQPRGRVAVLGGGQPTSGVLHLGRELPVWVRHGRLAGAGPFDLIVDATADPAGEVARFRESFLHLRGGGTYLVPATEQGTGEQLATFLGSAEGAPFATWVRSVRRRRAALLVVRRGRTLAKLREREMNEALAADPGRGRVLRTIPAAVLDSRCELGTSRPPQRDQTKARYEAPELFLREYAEATCRPKSVVVQRGLLCPDTYRHHLAPRLTHKMLREAVPRFAVMPKNEPPTARLEGTYFHLDNEIRGFFGHALTEQVSRLWAWQQARERCPDIKVLLSLNRGREVAGWEYELLEAGGIPRSDVVVIDQPVVVERLLSATPMFSMPDYVHPAIVETWDAVGSALSRRAEGREHPSRIFCTREHSKRECTNRAEVEELFASYGFEVVLPEKLPLPDQVELFRSADVVAGFAGSGMFTAMFSDRPTHLILVSPDTYGPSNEYMISAVRGHRLDVAIGHSAAAEGSDPLTAPFTVEMAAEGAWLRGVLDRLGSRA